MERSNRDTLKTAAREQSLCVKSCFVGPCAIEGSGKDTACVHVKGTFMDAKIVKLQGVLLLF